VSRAVCGRLMSVRALRFVLLGIVLAAAVLVGARWGRLRPVAALHGEVFTRPVAQGRAVAWLERRTDGDYLLLWSGRGSPRELLSAPTLGGLAFFGDCLFTTRGDAGGTADLLSLDTHTGKQERLASLTAPASALAVDGDWICGLSSSDRGPSSIRFIVAAGGADQLWTVPRRGGRPTSLTQTRGGVEGRMRLLGTCSGYVYWALRNSRGVGATTLLRRRLPDGAPEVLAREPGPQDAVLAGTQVAWTCYSREAATPSARRAVKAAALSGENPRVIADWLSPEVLLLSSEAGLYAYEWEALWRLGRARGEQWIVAYGSTQRRAPAVAAGVEYVLEQEKQEKVPRLSARGLSWPAKLRLALGL